MTDNKEYYFNLKRTEFENLKKTYTNKGTVSWSTFKNDPSTHQKKRVELAQSDFDYGTLRVQYPCYLVLSENISFNPNRPTTWLDSGDNITTDFSLAAKIDPNRTLDWFPDAGVTGNSQYFESDVAFAYGLGFFAAITIECRDTILDLNGYYLQQHPEHQLQQRFFACVELADQPFIPMQGPSNFGSILRSAHNVCICNGKISRSSHHGIHGNDGDYILMEDLTFENCEVAAVAVNGFKNVYQKNILVTKNDQNIPVLGTYSASRFIKSFVTLVNTNGHQTAELNNYMDVLDTYMEQAFNSIIFSNGTVPDLFKNVSGLIDGNAYGLLINPKGVAVGPFLENRNTSKSTETTNIYMANCHVDNIKGKINEIVGISKITGAGVQVDTAGSVLQVFNGVSSITGDKYYYLGTPLSNVQIELAKIKINNSLTYLGTLNIEQPIVNWKENSGIYFKVENGNFVQYNSSDVLTGTSYVIKGNGDSMFHVNKGMIGIKIDGACNLCMTDCAVTNVSNIGNSGSTLPGVYVKSHDDSGSKLIGYQGAKTYGITLSAVNDAVLKNFNCSNINSGNSSAYGVVIQNGSCNVNICNMNINNITSDVDSTFAPEDVGLPNEVPVSRGLRVTSDCNNITVKNISVKNIENSDGNPYNFEYDIHTEINWA